ncbi:LPXTG cell wall anchor domain-containing protein [Verrucosispora sp. TAA-831]|uniref:LPXTG cell wall anchor domain-containing protein n=1 Tax=Verrucosispora sp. TAA-831 TaxID=3422227 RepID=UPI003D6E878C
MIFRTRRAASLATAALLALGAVAAFGAPANAAGTETDLAITSAGTRVAEGSWGKLAWAKIANQGKNTPSKVSLKVDASKVDESKLWFAMYTEGGCTFDSDPDPNLFVCELDKTEIPGPGETVELPLLLIKTGETATGPYKAPVTITIESPDDTDDSNNSVTFDVEVTPESGVDLGVIVPDVKTGIDFETEKESDKLLPGDTSIVFGAVLNQGDLIAQGVKLTFQLPVGVTFAFPVEGWEISADNRSAVCDDKTLVIGTDEVLIIDMPIVVDEDVKAPVALKDGWLKAEAHGALPPGARFSKQATIPDFDRAEVREIEDTEFADIDPSDNSDDFAVIVAAAGNGGGGGGLPVTGVQAGVIGAVGAGVVLAGAAMFLVSRRRRVVLVTPGDEKTNS